MTRGGGGDFVVEVFIPLYIAAIRAMRFTDVILIWRRHFPGEVVDALTQGVY